MVQWLRVLASGGRGLEFIFWLGQLCGDIDLGKKCLDLVSNIFILIPDILPAHGAYRDA